MLHTFSVEFDHHAPRGGRTAFLDLAESMAALLPAALRIVADPIFTYGRQSPLAALDAIDDSQPQIVYLSNIVMHAAVLVVGDLPPDELIRFLSSWEPSCHQGGLSLPETLPLPITYDSLASFRKQPVIVGHHFDPDGLSASHAFDHDTLVISNVANWSLRDEESGEPAKEVFEILASRQLNGSEVFLCHIRDYRKYFLHAGRPTDEETYFIPDPADLIIETCLKHFAQGTLRQYLLGQGVPFATIGDCHMDDDYVVSYYREFWRLPESTIAFVQ